ncbi:MAG TPA: PAS domain S-box protein, partial [Thermoanaerobaculia bacterium]|nr:PAS domain S-box protein [Thermoanaerobaculia bacterium]
MTVSDHDLGIDELRARLQEAEETLRAILRGDVDSLVVPATDGDQVFSLRGAERPYRIFVEQMSEGALTISLDGLILFCNRRLGDLLSLSPDAIVGQYVGALPYPELMECIAAQLADRESQGSPREVACDAGGVTRTLQVIGSHLQGEWSVAFLIRDVTEARSRERELRRSNEEMEDRIRERTATLARTLEEVREARVAALNMMEDAVLAARALEGANRDLERQIAVTRESEERQRLLSTVVEQAGESIVITNTSGMIEYVNPAFERVTGFARAEAIGELSRILNSEEHDEAFYAALWQTIREGAVWTGHVVNRRKDGAVIEEEATISPVRDIDGTVTHFVAISRDVTSEIALGEQLRHAQKMEAIGT